MINIRDDKIDCIIIIHSFSSLFFIRIIILLSIIYTDIQTKIIPGTQKIAIIKISPSHILYNPIFMSNVASPSTAYWPLKSGFSNIYFLFWGRGDAPSLSAALSSICCDYSEQSARYYRVAAFPAYTFRRQDHSSHFSGLVS